MNAERRRSDRTEAGLEASDVTEPVYLTGVLAMDFILSESHKAIGKVRTWTELGKQ